MKLRNIASAHQVTTVRGESLHYTIRSLDPMTENWQGVQNIRDRFWHKGDREIYSVDCFPL